MTVVLKARPDRAAIYELERSSIRAFVESHRFEGRVLDFGCGKQPYRDIVWRDGAEYIPYDRARFPGGNGGTLGANPTTGMKLDQILCTQVLQYVLDPYVTLKNLAGLADTLVITGPDCWHHEEPTSLRRWSPEGIRYELTRAGWTVERLEDRGTLDVGGFPISVGWGAVART